VHIVSIRQISIWLYLCHCLSFRHLPKQFQLSRLHVTLRQLLHINHLHFLPNGLRIVWFELHYVVPIWHVC
jgi:hypothetical protein